MSANKFLPHVLVLPEDDANSQLANGFHLQVDSTRYRQMDVLPVAGGWNEVVKSFLSDQVAYMNQYPRRYMVLLMDFDGRPQRLNDAKARIPVHLSERVFILGALSEPEELTKELGSFETIGSGLAEDCREETDTTWGHELLRHNAHELDRLRESVRPILFSP